MRDLIARLYALEPAAQVAVVATGGGVQLGAWLLQVPGASAAVLEAQTPYARAAQLEYCGLREDPADGGFCSAAHARRLAAAALRRAVRLSDAAQRPETAAAARFIGLSCTAALVSARPKRGEHRAFVAAATPQGLFERSVTLSKGARSREGEDELVASVALATLLEAAGLPPPADDALGVEVVAGDALGATAFTPSAAGAARVLAGEAQSVTFLDGAGAELADAPLRWVLVPGSFNPAHEGHEALAAAAERAAGRPAAFELSATNVDKPPLAEDVLEARVAQFAGRRAVVVTRAPMFIDKARLFPGADFVIGADTAVRVLNPRYYGGTEAGMVAALAEFAHLGCRFWVAGRVDAASGAYVTHADIAVPAGLEGIFLPLESPRVDVSSTELRASGVVVGSSSSSSS